MLSKISIFEYQILQLIVLQNYVRWTLGTVVPVSRALELEIVTWFIAFLVYYEAPGNNHEQLC